MKTINLDTLGKMLKQKGIQRVELGEGMQVEGYTKFSFSLGDTYLYIFIDTKNENKIYKKKLEGYKNHKGVYFYEELPRKRERFAIKLINFLKIEKMLKGKDENSNSKYFDFLKSFLEGMYSLEELTIKNKNVYFYSTEVEVGGVEYELGHTLRPNLYESMFCQEAYQGYRGEYHRAYYDKLKSQGWRYDKYINGFIREPILDYKLSTKIRNAFYYKKLHTFKNMLPFLEMYLEEQGIERKIPGKAVLYNKIK